MAGQMVFSTRLAYGEAGRQITIGNIFFDEALNFGIGYVTQHVSGLLSVIAIII
ncbi:MAG: hypothetical protein PHT96_06190 [Syntrophorhabdaceae bacterium]|nr:hypothetical protein [Syntrophorhabdaceae bacterium]MDD4195986.1 hypothetical protein [Syntrophorhabdaceae bacterium]HOC45493.1 hypothetical protein [Syntrophorhabdaceae bacterium]